MVGDPYRANAHSRSSCSFMRLNDSDHAALRQPPSLLGELSHEELRVISGEADFCSLTSSACPGTSLGVITAVAAGIATIRAHAPPFASTGLQHVCVLALDRRLPLPVAIVIGTTTPGSAASAAWSASS